jgi:hypothetical protein
MFGLAAALAAFTACVPGAASSSPAATTPTKIQIGAGGGILVSAYGSVWTTDLVLNRLVRIDPSAPRVSGKVRLGWLL